MPDNDVLRVNNGQLIRAMTALFDQFCEAHVVTDDIRHTVPLTAFLRWTAGPARSKLEDPDELDHLAREAGVPSAAFRGVLAFATHPSGPNHAIALWPFVVLARRPNRHKIRSVTVAAVVQFDDGTALPFQSILHDDAATEPITDAWVFHALTVRSSELASHVAQFSLDDLHDSKQDRCGGMADPETLTLLRSAVESFKRAAVLPDERVAALDRLVNFAGELLARDLPPHLAADAARQLKAVAAPAKPVGGFDGGD